MKYSLFALSLIAPCIFFSACSGTAGGTADEITTETPAEVKKLDIITDGKTSYSIVRSVEAERYELRLIAQFGTELKDRTKVDFDIKVDIMSKNEYEILIGNTERAESNDLADKLNAAGGNRFGIAALGTKLAVVGTDLIQTYLGLDYLLTNHVTTDSSGNIIMSISDGYEYISEDNDFAFDPGALADDGRGSSFVSTQWLVKIPAENGFGIQGGGTDGKYAYFGLINGHSKPEPARIYKYDLETWELVAASGLLPTAHTNDITYDSKNNRLVVSNCSSLDGYYGLTLLDPDTLEVISTFKAPVTSRAIDYIPELDQYVVGTGYTIMVTDADWNKLASFKCSDPQYTTQGLCSDGKYIYDVRYVGSKAETHYIIIHDLDGGYIGSAPLRGIGGEPENIFKVGNDFYMGCNGTNNVYKLTLVPDNWW